MRLLARLRRLPDWVWVLLAWLPVAQYQVAPWSRRNSLDDIAYAAANHHVTLDALLSGHVPLWNPYLFGGSPHLGNVQTAALYPGHLLAAPFPNLLGIDIELAAHVLLAGMGWWLLGRRMDLSRTAAVAMGVLAMWCGATVGRAGAVVHLLPLTWVPWLLVGTLAVVRAARPWRAVAGTAVAAWCLVASGHPQSILMGATLAGAWAAGVVVQQRTPRRLLHLGAAAGLAGAMAAPILLAARAAIDAQYASSRTVAALSTPWFVTAPKATAATLLGQPLAPLRQNLSNHESIAYIGAAAVALAVLGAVVAVRRRWWPVLAAVAAGLFGWALTYGPSSPVFRAARRWIPGFDQPRVSVRWWWVAVMAVVLLAGVAIDALGRERRRTDAAFVGAAALAVAVAAPFGLQTGAARTAALWLAAAAAVAAAWWWSGRRQAVALGAVAVVVAIELLWPLAMLTREGGDAATSTGDLIGAAPRALEGESGFALAIVDERFDEQYVAGAMRPNVSALVDVRSIDGYDGGVWVSRRWVAALRQFLPSFDTDLTFRAQLPPPFDPARMARLGVHHILYDPDRGPVDTSLPGWTQVPADDHFQIWENPAFEGDVTVWYRTELVASPEAAGDRIRDHFDEATGTGMVEDRGAVLTCDGVCEPDHVDSTAAEPGERRATVVAAHDAVVAFAEQFDDGWTATVDGRDVTPIAVDGAWVGVPVPAGEHDIVLRYRPGWWLPSLVLAWLAWLGVAALAVGDRWSAVAAAVRPRRARSSGRSTEDPPAG